MNSNDGNKGFVASERSEIAGRFRILTHLGEGTVGETYEAEDLIRQQKVVIKILHDDIVDDIGGFKKLRDLLNRLSALSHPQINRLYDYGETQGVIYLVTEKIEGVPLNEIDLRESPASELQSRLEDIIHQIATTCLDLGSFMPHGNLKMSNLWITERNRVSLSDYGYVWLASKSKIRSAAGFLGSKDHFPPEVFTDDESELPKRVDVFAIGKLWLHLIQKAKQAHPSFTTPGHHQDLIQALLTEEQNPRGVLEQLRQTIGTSNVKKPPSFLAWNQRLPPRWGLPQLVALLFLILFIFSLALPKESGETIEKPAMAAYQSAQKDLYTVLEQHQTILGHRSGFPALDSALSSAFSSKSLLDLATRLGQATAQDPIDLQKLEQVQQELNILSSASETLDRFQKTLVPLKEIEEVLSILLDLEGVGAEAEERLDRLLARRAVIHDKAIAGTISDATRIAQSEIDSHDRWMSEIRVSIEGAYLSEKNRWKKALEEHQLSYLEPNRTLPAIIDGNGLSRVHQAEAILPLPKATQTLSSWIAEFSQIKPPRSNQRVNSIAMRFVPVGPLWVSIWETRVIDFALYVSSTGADLRKLWREAAQNVGPTHPVANISRIDAHDFCRWLTERERHQGLLSESEEYRLPTDAEWSLFVEASPANDYPWSNPEAPLKDRGNYYTWPNSTEANDFFKKHDPFHTTAPVGQFPPNRLQLHDLGGNVWEMVSENLFKEIYNTARSSITIRGGGWRSTALDEMRSSFRRTIITDHPEVGFRAVLAPIHKEVSDEP